MIIGCVVPKKFFCVCFSSQLNTLTKCHTVGRKVNTNIANNAIYVAVHERKQQQQTLVDRQDENITTHRGSDLRPLFALKMSVTEKYYNSEGKGVYLSFTGDMKNTDYILLKTTPDTNFLWMYKSASANSFKRIGWKSSSKLNAPYNFLNKP